MRPMQPTLHIVVARSRAGWSVTLDADRLFDHASLERAREYAAQQAAIARRDGERVSLVDLSRACGA
jgi:hypothetical protein